jgi:hypothetical protein
MDRSSAWRHRHGRPPGLRWQDPEGIELSQRQRPPALQEHIPDQALQTLQGVAAQADKAEIHQEGVPEPSSQRRRRRCG